jgi:hypothetical protein
MEKRSRLLAFAVSYALCALWGAGIAFGVAIPEKLKDIPLYQGSTVQHTMDMDSHTMLVAVVKAKAEDVAAFFKKTMTEKGWKTAFQMATESGQTMQFKKDKQMLQISIQQDEGAGSATYTMVITSE